MEYILKIRKNNLNEKNNTITWNTNNIKKFQVRIALKNKLYKWWDRTYIPKQQTEVNGKMLHFQLDCMYVLYL